MIDSVVENLLPAGIIFDANFLTDFAWEDYPVYPTWARSTETRYHCKIIISFVITSTAHNSYFSMLGLLVMTNIEGEGERHSIVLKVESGLFTHCKFSIESDFKKVTNE